MNQENGINEIIKNPTGPSSPKVDTALDNMINGYTKRTSEEQRKQASTILKTFLRGQDFDLKYTTGFDSRLLDLLITGLLLIIQIDENNAIRAKNKIAQALNPLNNPKLLQQVIDKYNKASDSVTKIKSITPLVKLIVQKTFYYNFDRLLDTRWMQEHKKELGPGFIGFFLLHFYFQFNYFYNEYVKNPDKFPQIQAQLNPKLNKEVPKDETRDYTVSNIIKYIYSVGSKFNPKIADAFNKSNKEIIEALKKEIPNPKVWKLFQYIIDKKLDPEEIVDFDKDFKTNADITGGFNNFATKNAKAISIIDSIYKKNGLKLPSFSKWKASDLNKGASDRGELKADAPEIGTNQKGELSKIYYDKYGDKTYNKMQEVRMLIRKIMQEHFKNTI